MTEIIVTVLVIVLSIAMLVFLYYEMENIDLTIDRREIQNNQRIDGKDEKRKQKRI